MRITVAYNERTRHNEEQGELIPPEDIDAYCKAISSLGHDVTPLEVSGASDAVIDRLEQSDPELVFNIAEGHQGRDREAFYANIYEYIGLPFTGAGSSMLQLGLDKRLTQLVVERAGVRVPRGRIVTPEDRAIPEEAGFPLFVKPNYEGSSKGISQDSVCRTREQAEIQIDRLLERYPDGLNVEQYIAGRDITMPVLFDWSGKLLAPVEHTFNGEHETYDFALKHRKDQQDLIEVHCPPRLESDQRKDLERATHRAMAILPLRDMARFDFRLDDKGRCWFLEVNALPRLAVDASLATAAKQGGLSYPEMFDRILNSAIKRHRLDN